MTNHPPTKNSCALAAIKNFIILPWVHLIANFLPGRDRRIAWKEFRFYPKYKPIEYPVVFMTLLVKNERDIIEENLLFHKSMGVDGIIVTDNGSSDGTTELLKKYLEKGIIKELIFDPSDTYTQDKKVDKMIQIAECKYHADWIINADADEFFYTPVCDVHKVLAHVKSNIVNVQSYAMFSPELNVKLPVQECTFSVKKSISNRILPQKYHIFKITRKVIHRVDGYVKIAYGNHDVEMEIPSVSSGGFIIYHYIYRGYEHFRRKVVNGSFALRNESKKVGNHWRYFSGIFDKGGDEALKQSYREALALDKLSMLKKKKFCKEDLTLAEYMARLKMLAK